MNQKLIEGTIIVIDLDKFSEEVKSRGWSEYSPNPATGLLTRLVEEFISKWYGVVVYGLDPERGTEEVVIEIPGVEPEEVLEDLRKIREEINSVGVGVSIVALRGYVIGRSTRSRRDAYYGTPFRAEAIKALRRVKKKGGNQILVL